MDRRLGSWAWVLGLAVLACSSEPAINGGSEQWVRGKTFSIQVNLASQHMELRNDSSGPANYSPLLLVGQYRTAGKKMKLLRSGSSQLKAGEQFSVPVGSQLGFEGQDALSELRVEIGEGAAKEIFLVK